VRKKLLHISGSANTQEPLQMNGASGGVKPVEQLSSGTVKSVNILGGNFLSGSISIK